VHAENTNAGGFAARSLHRRSERGKKVEQRVRTFCILPGSEKKGIA